MMQYRSILFYLGRRAPGPFDKCIPSGVGGGAGLGVADDQKAIEIANVLAARPPHCMS